VVDVNHPLAGQRVRFEVEVSSVRPASEEEIAKAQAELEERIEDADDGCGCGHDHDAPHEPPSPRPDGGPRQLSKKMLSQAPVAKVVGTEETGQGDESRA